MDDYPPQKPWKKCCAFTFIVVVTLSGLATFLQRKGTFVNSFKEMQKNTLHLGLLISNNNKPSETIEIGEKLGRASVMGDLLTAQEYIDTPIPLSIRNCAYAEGSSMNLVGDKSIFTLNDEIRVSFQLYDMNGHQLTRGGDAVRVWMRDKSQRANSAGYVVDFRNGSYMGVLRALWTGQAEIVGEVATMRERIQSIYRIVYYRPEPVSFVAYIGRNVTQDMQCASLPRLLPYKKLCNMTDANYGSEWYCGKPTKPNLLCYDYVATGVYMRRKNLSNFEDDLLGRCHAHFNQTLKVEIISDSNNNRVRPQLPCHKRPFQDTWTDSTPVGYFFKDVWFPRTCRSALAWTVNAYHSCLSNKRLHIYGDSTTRQYFLGLATKLKLDWENVWPGRQFYKYVAASSKEYNYSIVWGPHAQPFVFRDRKNMHYFRSIASYLEEIPALSDDFVWLHIYAHLAFYSPDIFEKRVQQIAQAVKRLVTRAPDVKIAIKGAYVFKGGYYSLEDYWGKVYDNILREKFRGLYEHVLFVDLWDFTLGLENIGLHPRMEKVMNMVHIFMAYMCGR